MHVGRRNQKARTRIGKISVMLRRKYYTLEVEKLRAKREEVHGLMKIKTAKYRQHKRAQLLSQCNRILVGGLEDYTEPPNSTSLGNKHEHCPSWWWRPHHHQALNGEKSSKRWPGPDKIHPFWNKHLPTINFGNRMPNVNRNIEWKVWHPEVAGVGKNEPKLGSKGESSKYRYTSVDRLVV